MRVVREPLERALQLRERRVDDRVAELRRLRPVVDRTRRKRLDARGLAPRHGGTDRQLDRLLVRLAESRRRVDERHLPRLGRRGQLPAHHGGIVLREANRARLAADPPRHLAVRPAPVRQRQRHLEDVAGRDEARRVGLHHEPGAHLLPDRRRARRAPVVRHRGDAHFAHELGERERDRGASVHERDIPLPQRERLEAARGRRAHAAEHLRAEAAARLDAVRPEHVVAVDRQEAVVEVVERIPRAALLREPGDRIGRLLVRQEVDPLVDDRHRRDRAGRDGAARRHVDEQRAQIARSRARRDRDGNLVFGAAHAQRLLAVRAHRHPAMTRGRALDDRDLHVDVRRVRGLDRTQRDLARRVGERHDLGVDEVVAHHAHERGAGERRLHHEARRLARTVERLVRDEGDGGRVGKRRAHLGIAPVAQVERLRIGDVRLGIGDRERIVAGRVDRQLQQRIGVGGHGQLQVLGDGLADARAVPRRPAFAVLAVGVDGVDARDRGREPLGRGEAASVRPHARDGHLGTPDLRTAEPRAERRADVVGVVVAVGYRARGRGASAVLEDRALGGRLDEGRGLARIGPERRRDAKRARRVERAARQRAEVRLEGALRVPERVALPARRHKRHILEDDRAFAAERLRGSAVEMLGRDGEREVDRRDARRRGDLDADLRRRELLDAHGALAERHALLARRLQAERPFAARLVRRHGERRVRDRAAGVGRERLVRIEVAGRLEELELDGERIGRDAPAVAQNRLEEHLLLVAVDAALRPGEGRAGVVREVAVAARRPDGLLDVHRPADREERAVAAVVLRDDDGERLALADRLARAEAVRIRVAPGDEDVRGGIDLDVHVRDGRSLRERGRPDVQALRRPADAETEIGDADDAVAPAVAAPVGLADLVAPLVRIADGNEEDAVGGRPFRRHDRQVEALFLVQPVRRDERMLRGVGGKVRHKALPLAGVGGADLAVDFLLDGEHRHDVLRRHDADVRRDLADVDAGDGERPAARRRQVASVIGEAHLRLQVGALEVIGKVLRERRDDDVGGRRETADGETAPDAQRGVGAVQEIAPHHEAGPIGIQFAVPALVARERERRLRTRLGCHIGRHDLHVGLFRKDDLQPVLSVVDNPLDLHLMMLGRRLRRRGDRPRVFGDRPRVRARYLLVLRAFQLFQATIQTKSHGGRCDRPRGQQRDKRAPNDIFSLHVCSFHSLLERNAGILQSF